MEYTGVKSSQQRDSYENAYHLTEFSKFVTDLGNDLGNSAGLFDAIGEKNELFRRFEEVSNTSTSELILQAHQSSHIFIRDYFYGNFINVFTNFKDKFNFIHVGKMSNSEIVFFISTKEESIQEILLKHEFEYATSPMVQYVDITFCFVESDMESSLMKTEKLELNG